MENPAYLGAFEPRAKEIMDLAHQAGAIGIVMPEVSSLGVVTPPSGYGADITCGDIQPLGIHMQYGSGCGGFIAMDNDPDYVNELPTYLYGISETQKTGSMAGAAPCTTGAATPPGKMPRNTLARNAAYGPLWPGPTWLPWGPGACRSWASGSCPMPPTP
ncbi:MAG: hypothetical protein ACLTC3_01600 [Evtepia gabavorous]